MDLSIAFYCDTVQDWKQYILFGMSSGIERNQCFPQLRFDAFPYIDKNLISYFFFSYPNTLETHMIQFAVYYHTHISFSKTAFQASLPLNHSG